MRRRSKDRQAELDARPAINSVSDDRSAEVGASSPNFQAFVRRLPCVVCLTPTLGGDPCHRLARRNAGDWVLFIHPGGVEREVIGNIYPACRAHHREQHDCGIDSFAKAHALDLLEVCKRVGAAYLAGWSANGLGVAARTSGYQAVGVGQVLDGELPY